MSAIDDLHFNELVMLMVVPPMHTIQILIKSPSWSINVAIKSSSRICKCLTFNVESTLSHYL